MMEADEYLTGRLEDQINWYDRKSQWNQKRYKWLRSVEIVAACLIPFLAGLAGSGDWATVLRIAVGVLGVIVAALSGIISHWKFHDLWITYRTTCESLKRHKFLYETRTRPYEGNDAFPLLVANVEELLSREHLDWTKHVKREEKPPNQAPGGRKK